MYEVPASKASIKQNRFEFKLPGDRKTYSIPKLQFVKPDLLDEVEGANRVDAVKQLLEHYHPGLWSAFDDVEQVKGFFEQWAEESGISLGESSASSES